MVPSSKHQMELTKKFTPPKRECDGCTVCCQGWLSAEALGYRFFPGQPCHWVGCNGCTVYSDRPPVCQNFECGWKESHFLPEWFKPTESNMIALWREWKAEEMCEEGENGQYLCLSECGKSMTAKHMTWLNNYAAAGVLNVKYQYEGRWHWIGSDAFCQWNCDGAVPITADDKKQEEKPKEVKLERARNSDGTYKADDLSTPDINEAWVEVEVDETTKPQ